MSLDCVKQYKVNLPDEVSKIKVITDKIMVFGPTNRQVIVFVRTRKLAEMLHQALVANESYYVSTIHGALTKQDTDAIVDLFNKRCIQVLITTDALAGEAFDQSLVGCILSFYCLMSSLIYLYLIIMFSIPHQVSLVVNFDLPLIRDSEEPDTDVYLQRLCSSGNTFSFLYKQRVSYLCILGTLQPSRPHTKFICKPKYMFSYRMHISIASFLHRFSYLPLFVSKLYSYYCFSYN